MDQRHPFTAIRQTSLVNAAHRHAGIFPGKGLRIGNQHNKPSGFQPHPQGKRVIDTVHTPDTTEIQSIRTHVLQFDEFEGVSINAALGSGMVMDLRHSKGVEGLDEGEGRLDQRTPIARIEHPGPDGSALVEGNFAGVGSGPGGHRSADFTRIGSVQRVADVANRSRDGQPESTDHVTAVLGEGGWHRGGIQVSRLQLSQDRGRPLGHVIGHDVVDSRQPVLIPVQRGGHLRITPAGRLRHHGGVNLVGPHRKAGSGGHGRQRAVVEEMFLDVVGHSKAELRIGAELLPQILRVALSNTPTGGCSVRSGPILGTIQQGVLGIMGRKPEPTVIPGPIPLSVPVVGRRVPEEVRNRRIEISAVKNHQHVVDEVIHIE